MSAFRCAFCDIDYDVIGKMETFDADFLYFVHAAGLQEEFPQAGQGLKMNSFPHTDNKTKEYFHQLSHEQKHTLFYLLKFDFELFGYSPKPYIDHLGEIVPLEEVLSTTMQKKLDN